MHAHVTNHAAHKNKWKVLNRTFFENESKAIQAMIADVVQEIEHDLRQEQEVGVQNGPALVQLTPCL